MSEQELQRTLRGVEEMLFMVIHSIGHPVTVNVKHLQCVIENATHRINIDDCGDGSFIFSTVKLEDE